MKKITPRSKRRRSATDPTRSLEKLRSEIDRLDALVVDALMRRSRIVLRIATLKARHGLGGVDVPRERAIFKRVETRRTKGGSRALRGYSRDAVERIYRVILDESRALLGTAKT